MILSVFLLANLTSTAALSDALSRGAIGETFDLSVTVASGIQTNADDFAVEDSSGAALITTGSCSNVSIVYPGSKIHARGILNRTGHGHIAADCTSLVQTGETTPPPIQSLTLRQFSSGKWDSRIIRTTGTLHDCFIDEIDNECIYLILNQGNDTIYATCYNQPTTFKTIERWLGSELSITGLCDPRPSGCRRKIGRILRFNDLKSVDIITPAPLDPFHSSPIVMENGIQPTDFITLRRHKTSGIVLAVWHGDTLLIKTPAHKISRILLAKDPSPSVGSCIDVVGIPETDLYRINFTRAIWRKSTVTPEMDHEVTAVTANTLMAALHGEAAINADFHGQTILLRGIVRSLPSIGNDGRFYLESDGYTLPVDISANPVLAEKLEIGSVIDVTGVCVMDIENWRPNLVFPHIKEVMIVTRTPDDIVVIERPPWWTPARLMIVIGSLLAVLVGILIWNRALKALAEKCGKALANEELERLVSDLKVCERTRLAVELHDSIAQNLTGVSMEIDTALRGEEQLPPTAAQHMGRALRTIDSCRGELRNCLWDLRSQALEEDDMNKAIRLTLSQTIGKADLIVRFNVPRSRFADNTAHTLLRIIRELAANAVRHGHATEIKVAGSIEDNILKFSVQDNGCGFDPDACPGVLEGHFGLQGVRERVASFEGNVQIESAPGKGTRVSVSINVPQTEDEEKI